MTEPNEGVSRAILVVEDDEGLRRLILKALAKAGYDAQGVPTGAEALERVAADPQLVLLLDQKLPDMEGSDIVVTLRERGFRIPFIFMTGRGDERFAVQHAMVANISDVIAIIDADGINRYRSPNALKLFGWSPEELIGISTFDYVHPEDQGAMREFFGKLLLEPNSTGTSECRYQCKDGSYKWIEFTASNLIDDPRIHGVLLNYRDVSERKRSEDQLRKNLEEKEILLREVHHRLKNNLNVISSLLSLQSSFIKPPEQAMEAFRISRDRIMAMSIVHEELYQSSDYSRIDMASFLDKLTRHVLPSDASKNGIRLETRAEGVALSVNASIPCGLILTELITNAFRHAFPEGGPGGIRVTLGRENDDLIGLSVSDDGIGLGGGHEEGGSSEGESSALGLTLVRLLVEQLEGTMTIGAGAGTDFRIRFPERLSNSSGPAVVYKPQEFNPGNTIRITRA